jgi:uncharacterized protein HemY
MGDTKRSLPLLEEAVRGVPRSAVFNYHLGMALYAAGDKNKARDVLKTAVESGEEFSGRMEAIEVLRGLS